MIDCSYGDRRTAPCRRRITVPVDAQNNKRETEKLQSQEQQLLPGILDEITVDLITPKLPWESVVMLSGVSRGWRQTIRRRRVYDSRVHASSTETLVVNTHEHPSNPHKIALYSMMNVVINFLQSQDSLMEIHCFVDAYHSTVKCITWVENWAKLPANQYSCSM